MTINTVCKDPVSSDVHVLECSDVILDYHAKALARCIVYKDSHIVTLTGVTNTYIYYSTQQDTY